MKLTEAIARHFYEVNYGDNWTDVAVKDVLKDITWEQAIQRIGNTNTIAVLVHHMNFYNMVVYDRLLEQSKKFRHEDSVAVVIEDETAWLQLQQDYFKNVDRIHKRILQLDESVLFELKTANTLYKNLHGLIEHIHYHLGQVSLLKKIVSTS